MSRAVVLGAGLHPWGKFPDTTFVELATSAIRDALADAGVDWKEVGALHAGVDVYSGASGLNAGNLIARAMGETGIPVTNYQNGCATAGVALKQAYEDVLTSRVDIAVAVGAGKSPDGFYPALQASVPVPDDLDTLRWEVVGATNPTYWAIECRRRMERYGTTRADLAAVKVMLSRNGSQNHNARFRKPFSLDDVLEAPMVADPLTLLEICATSDGGAAVVVCSQERSRRYSGKPIELLSVATATVEFGDPSLRIPMVSAPPPGGVGPMSESRLSALAAYQEAGVEPADLDFIEVPDNSTWHVFEYLESLGICRPGEADGLVRDGEVAVDGRIPVGPSGGFASFGEAVAAQGLAQIYELVVQLRGEAGPRQVSRAKVGLAQTFGAFGNASTAILAN